ncbi:MAG: type III pantothenate kinase [Aquificaceae bacterium]
MKVLTIDVGNTSVDLCLFEEDLIPVGKFSHYCTPKVDADLVLVSSVKPSINSYIKSLYPKARFLSPEDVPIETAFEGKEKVGVDRLINLYGALSLYGKDVVVVSAGTALVVDLLVDGVFQGGFITIGIGLGLNCLVQRAELIPPMELKEIRTLIGRSIEEALIGGLINQAKHFVLGSLESWKSYWKRDLSLVITGGDGYLFKDIGQYDPLLPHKGMRVMV